ncbi:hypothetical protein LINGRAHAP2_LOCUS11508, partial [Linum grandiflorum]
MLPGHSNIMEQLLYELNCHYCCGGITQSVNCHV